MNHIDKNTMRHRWLAIAKNFKFLPDEQFVKILYECYTARKLDLDHPVTFNQKIQWYKVFYKNPLLTQLADKYAVRSYVQKRVGAQYLNTLLASYDHPDEIDYDLLPNKFVLKVVHGCAFNILVTDKANFDQKEARKKMIKWLKKDYYAKGKEWAYKNIPPKIIAETFMEEPGKTVLNDYKFYCFDGIVKFVQVDLDRGTNYLRAHYSPEWEKLPFSTHLYNPYEGDVPEPSNLEEMIQVAQKLSQGIPFVRVDLYGIEGKTVFGEMTFYPASGLTLYSPDEYNKILGDYFTLPEKIVSV